MPCFPEHVWPNPETRQPSLLRRARLFLMSLERCIRDCDLGVQNLMRDGYTVRVLV